MNQAALFQLLHSRGITLKTVHGLLEWPSRRLFSFFDALRESVTDPTPATSGPFNFVANDSLSGRFVPFATHATRKRNVTQLARFAALYADTLLLRNPFESYPKPIVGLDELGTRHELGHGLEPRHFNKSSQRQQFVDDLAILLFLRPLFASAIVDLCQSALHYCPSCVRALVDHGELEKLVREPEEMAWQRRIAKMVKCIEDVFLRRGKTLLHQHGDHAHATMFPQQGMLEYDQMQLTLELPERLAKRAVDPIPASLRDARKLLLFADEVDRIVGDISTQNATANRFNCQYISDRLLDLELMDLVSDRKARAFNRAAVEALGHPVAFIDNVPLDGLLRLRNREGESFVVYRDAVKRVLSEAQGRTANELREALEDEIRPELNRIDLLLRNSRKAIGASALTDALLVAASVSIAAFSGVLPPGLVPPEIVNVGAALGGWEGMRGLATKVSKLRETPEEVSENRFAFLWRVRRTAPKA